MAEKKKIEAQKQAMIEAMKKSLGIVSSAVQKVGISRQTHYNWLESDPDYAAKIDEAYEFEIDFVEGQLFKKIQSGDSTSIIFYLKTKGKKRGYIERSELKVDANVKEIRVIREDAQIID